MRWGKRERVDGDAVGRLGGGSHETSTTAHNTAGTIPPPLHYHIPAATPPRRSAIQPPRNAPAGDAFCDELLEVFLKKLRLKKGECDLK